MVEVLFVVFVVYVIPAVITYFGIRRQYKTAWTSITPDASDLLMVITPLLNMGFAIFVTLDLVFYAVEKVGAKVASILNRSMGGFIDKFFRIKK